MRANVEEADCQSKADDKTSCIGRGGGGNLL